MWSRHLTIWLLKMSSLNSKPIEDSLKMFSSSTSSRRVLSKISIKKMAPITMIAICPIKLLRRPVMTIRTSSMVRLSPRSTKWSRKIKKMILRKLSLIRCGKKNWDKIPNCYSTAKSMKSTWCKKTLRTFCTEQCAKTCSSGTSSPSRKATTNQQQK